MNNGWLTHRQDTRIDRMNPMKTYRHKKTGAIYWLLAFAVNKSCGMDGSPMVVYCPADRGNTIFVRKQYEFMEVFEAVSEDGLTCPG